MVVFHVKSVYEWVRRGWKVYVAFAAMVFVFGVMSPSSLPQRAASWAWLCFDLPALTAVWLSGFVCYHEILNSRFHYGDPRKAETITKLIPSLKSEDQIVKV